MLNPNLDGLKMGTCGQTSWVGWRKKLRETDKFGDECLVNGEKLA